MYVVCCYMFMFAEYRVVYYVVSVIVLAFQVHVSLRHLGSLNFHTGNRVRHTWMFFVTTMGIPFHIVFGGRLFEASPKFRPRN